jgi:hypothetical protein
MDEEQRTLPPGIDGNHTGTLKLKFMHCSVPNSFARVHFWGGVGYDVYPNKSINFILVGEKFAIAKYLSDASPLHIKILAKDATLIGNVFIPDLSLPTQSLDCKRSSTGVISLRQTIIGDATFELHFVMYTQPQTDNMALSQPSQQYVDVPDFEVDQLLDQASDIEVIDLCGSTTQEKRSLISDLLDICSDDMTIPTVDTSLVAATGVDPYDVWIASIESSATSPPRMSGQSNETVKKRCQPTLETFPHPISLFLSNVATATASNANATQLRSSFSTQHSARVTVAKSKFEPVQPPPIWIDVGVYCISNLRIVSVIGRSTTFNKARHSLELNLTCDKPLLSMCDLVQSSALLDRDASNFLSDCVKRVETKNERSDLVSIATQLSWQVGIKSLNVAGGVEITLQLRSCCDDVKEIVGQVSIPLCQQRVESSYSLGFLPKFDACGWFDILDTNSHPIGKIQLSLASGTLKQIRSLPKAHTCAAAIQRYWRGTRSIERCIATVGEGNEAPTPDEESFERKPTSLEKIDDDGDDEDTFHSYPPPPPDNSDSHTNEDSSPDSLFEEWSQQSFLRADANEKDVNAARAAENDVGLAVDTSLVKSTYTDKDIHAYTPVKGGAERNATFNLNSTSSASEVFVAELLEPSRSPNRRQPIDPPEGSALPTKAQIEMKRKMDQSHLSAVPEAKRHRVTNDSAPSETNRPSESQTSSSPNLHAGPSDKFADEEDSSDSDDVKTYRSLRSIMKSLAGVEARLKGDDSCIAPPTSALGCRSEEAVSANLVSDDRSDGSVKTLQVQSPSKTRSITETTNCKTREKGKPCEKGTSQLLVDAATSPCAEDGSFEVQEEKEEIGTNCARENESEESGGTFKNVDRSTLQLDWSLNKLTCNHSTQCLFPTLSTSSDRRDRYSSLFNVQPSCTRGTLKRGSLLSPAGGAPRIEETRVDSSGYKRYLSRGRMPPDGGFSSSPPAFNFTSANSDRIEQIFSGNKKKKN